MLLLFFLLLVVVAGLLLVLLLFLLFLVVGILVLLLLLLLLVFGLLLILLLFVFLLFVGILLVLLLLLLVVFLLLVLVLFAVLILLLLLLLVELLESFFDDIGIEQGILVLDSTLKLPAHVVGTLKLFQRAGPLLDFLIRVLRFLTKPEKRVAQIIKSTLLQGKGGFGYVECLAKVFLRLGEIPGLIRGCAGVVVQSRSDRGIFICF